jgi:ankyrin repeat protein
MFVGGCGCCRCVKALVEAGANVDMQTHSSKEKNKGAVALHYAAQEDHHEVVQYLIRKSAGVNIQDARGCTPLHYAVYKGLFFF